MALAVFLSGVAYDAFNEYVGLPDIRFVDGWGGFLTGLGLLALFNFFWAVRRLHDIGASGFWMLVAHPSTPAAVFMIAAELDHSGSMLAPGAAAWAIAGLIFQFWLYFAPADPAANPYGDPPI